MDTSAEVDLSLKFTDDDENVEVWEIEGEKRKKE